MAIDLQKLEQKFDALINDPNFVTDFEQWLDLRASSQHDAKLLVSRSPIYGIFRFDNKGYVGYWTNYEAGKKVFEEEYDNGEWYYDEMVCQDCG